MTKETSITCSSCGGSLDGSSRCPYCKNLVIQELVARPTPEVKKVRLLTEDQEKLVNEYLDGHDEHKNNIRKVLHILMLDYDDRTLSNLLRPLVDPNRPTWNVEWIANTSNRNNRNYDLTQHFFSHGIEKRVLRSLPREIEVTV